MLTEAKLNTKKQMQQQRINKALQEGMVIEFPNRVYIPLSRICDASNSRSQSSKNVDGSMSKLLLSDMAPEEYRIAIECFEMLVQKILEVSNLIIQPPAMPYVLKSRRMRWREKWNAMARCANLKKRNAGEP